MLMLIFIIITMCIAIAHFTFNLWLFIKELKLRKAINEEMKKINKQIDGLIK